MSDEQSIPMNLISIVLAILYIISPFDFIPDAIPVVGIFDDIIALLFAVERILKLIQIMIPLLIVVALIYILIGVFSCQ